MGVIDCACGAIYGAQDAHAIKRHEATAKHQNGVASMTAAEAAEAFDDLDLDEPDPDMMSAQQSDDDAAKAAKPKRTRKTKIATTWADLDKTPAAKAFTEDERVTIATQVGLTKSVHDLSIEPKHIAESYVAAVLDATPNINGEILDDLQAYVEGAVRIIRSEGNGETPQPTEAKRTRKREAAEQVVVETKAEAKPKVVKPKSTKTVSGTSEHKVCRTCGKDKPLDEFRRKASRPDGRDTNCTECSKNWFIANQAKKAAAK